MKKLICYQKKIKCSWLMAAVLAGCLLLMASAASAATNVYAEGAYDDSVLVVYVYADITEDAPLVSQCIKVTYNPSRLHMDSADKNEAVWYFGNGRADYKYKDPEDTGNAVVVLGGKLDTNNPTAGVHGDRVLLAKINFTRLEAGAPDDPLAPENYFDVSLSLGKDGKFSNFVDVDGNIQDGSGLFTDITIREFGDANGDGSISATDYLVVRDNISAAEFPPYIDCNKDGSVSATDYLCIRDKI